MSVIGLVLMAASFTFVSAQDEEITPETTVMTFYSWYLKWTNEKQNPTKNMEATNYYLSARFSQWYYSKEGQNVNYNVFVDGQQWNDAWAKNIKVGEAAITGDKANLKLMLSAPPDGPVMTLQISLVKERGEWKIDAVKNL